MSEKMKPKLIKMLLSLLCEETCEKEEPSQMSSAPISNESNAGKYCIIRTYSAGVYFGKLKATIGQGFQGGIILLEEARLIHSWNGAKTTLDVANNGISSGNLSSVSDELEITGVIAVIPCSKIAKEKFLGMKKAEYKF